MYLKIKEFFIRNYFLNHNCDNHIELVEDSTDMYGYNNLGEWGFFKCRCCNKGFQMSKKTFNKIKR